MASASNAFRSHLMQQFAATARSQSRPPLAMTGSSSLSSSSSRPGRSLSPEGSDTESSSLPRNDSKPYPTNIVGSYKPTSSSWKPPSGHRYFSSDSSYVPALPDECNKNASSENNSHDEEVPEKEITEAAQEMNNLQKLIQTRHSVSNSHTTTGMTVAAVDCKEFWMNAMMRAVQCTIMAPNHKHPEPFTFKRLVAPSTSTEKLCQICHNYWSMERLKPERAMQKLQKWRDVPAFLVALVSGQPSQQHFSTTTTRPYSVLPQITPSSERQLEDFAATCAAVQNVLLSLHSEGIGSKWATGPVIRTPAFRSLVQAQDDELVVGLIMVGSGGRIPKAPPCKRRSLQDDCQACAKVHYLDNPLAKLYDREKRGQDTRQGLREANNTTKAINVLGIVGIAIEPLESFVLRGRDRTGSIYRYSWPSLLYLSDLPRTLSFTLAIKVAHADICAASIHTVQTLLGSRGTHE
eukprot:scaffold7454_cov53-Attheya_sp.AAC.7